MRVSCADAPKIATSRNGSYPIVDSPPDTRCEPSVTVYLVKVAVGAPSAEPLTTTAAMTTLAAMPMRTKRLNTEQPLPPPVHRQRSPVKPSPRTASIPACPYAGGPSASEHGVGLGQVSDAGDGDAPARDGIAHELAAVGDGVEVVTLPGRLERDLHGEGDGHRVRGLAAGRWGHVAIPTRAEFAGDCQRADRAAEHRAHHVRPTS